MRNVIFGIFLGVLIVVEIMILVDTQVTYPTNKQLKSEITELRQRVDANDAIVNRWLMEGGQKP